MQQLHHLSQSSFSLPGKNRQILRLCFSAGLTQINSNDPAKGLGRCKNVCRIGCKHTITISIQFAYTKINATLEEPILSLPVLLSCVLSCSRATSELFHVISESSSNSSTINFHLLLFVYWMLCAELSINSLWCRVKLENFVFILPGLSGRMNTKLSWVVNVFHEMYLILLCYCSHVWFIYDFSLFLWIFRPKFPTFQNKSVIPIGITQCTSKRCAFYVEDKLLSDSMTFVSMTEIR